MDQFFIFLEEKFLAWMCLFVRFTGFFVIAPFFSERAFPVIVKVFLALFTSWLTLYSSDIELPLDTPVLGFTLNVVFNFLVGMGLGFIVYLFLQVFNGAGYVFGFQIGFGMEEVFALGEEQTNPTGGLLYFLALTVFVLIKGPLLIFEGLRDSLRVFPIDLVNLKSDFFAYIVGRSGEFFVMILKIGAPVIAFMLIISIVLGIVSRLIPQMNVFMVGLPLKVIVGVILILGMLPIWAEMAQRVSSLTLNAIQELLGK
ncbi:flagellar biosynthetic protein FliR [Thermotoga sp. KOL6]|uniref:flagellar biosynthetic protein FliR n=1 Tax=Thermotoga sp. KOL6 TaxID=126741 RepID=UPI000CC10007|nr:flagellar biosynthetic protein FliR [Thermotoga sp. KOL6]PLV58388.1 flagellar biosynthetic protein FliR [Thermotoga sp. KOL6]